MYDLRTIAFYDIYKIFVTGYLAGNELVVLLVIRVVEINAIFRLVWVGILFYHYENLPIYTHRYFVFQKKKKSLEMFILIFALKIYIVGIR